MKTNALIAILLAFVLSSCANRIYQSVNEGDNTVKISFINHSANKYLDITTYKENFDCKDPRWISVFATRLWQDEIMAPKADYMTLKWEYWTGTTGLTEKTISHCGAIFTFPMNAEEYRVEFDADPASGQCGFKLYEKSDDKNWIVSDGIVKRRGAGGIFLNGPWCAEEKQFSMPGASVK